MGADGSADGGDLAPGAAGRQSGTRDDRPGSRAALAAARAVPLAVAGRADRSAAGGRFPATSWRSKPCCAAAASVGGEHHLFGACATPIRRSCSTRAPASSPASSLRSGKVCRATSARGPTRAILRYLGGASSTPPDANGYSRLLGGVWRRQFDRFTLMSFHPEILDLISPQLQFEKAERPAQVWLHTDDLAKSKLAPVINAYGYRQSRQVTQGNTRFLNMLTEQLHVPPAEGMATAEQLLDAKLMSPLGGEYELRNLSSGAKAWVSTALAESAQRHFGPQRLSVSGAQLAARHASRAARAGRTAGRAWRVHHAGRNAPGRRRFPASQFLGWQTGGHAQARSSQAGPQPDAPRPRRNHPCRSSPCRLRRPT